MAVKTDSLGLANYNSLKMQYTLGRLFGSEEQSSIYLHSWILSDREQ